MSRWGEEEPYRPAPRPSAGGTDGGAQGSARGTDHVVTSGAPGGQDAGVSRTTVTKWSLSSPTPARSAPSDRISMFTGPVVSQLVSSMAVTLAIGVGVILGARFLGAGFYPIPTLVVAGILGVCWWAVMMVSDWPMYERWQPASAVDPSLRVASDPRTRRLESMLSGADAKHRMSARDVARTLSVMVEDTLVRTYGADPADPLAAAEGRLSPSLVAFLRAAPAGPVPAVTRRLLRGWLTEIDTLSRQRGTHG